MKSFLTLLTILIAGFAFAPSARATEKPAAAPVYDDFGGTYFTEATPDALSEGDALFSAEELNSIEPAAGEDSGFILPEDAADEAVRAMESDRLDAPGEPLVPGME